MTKNDFNWLFE